MHESNLFDYQSEKRLLIPRPRNAHKNLFGHVLIIGGDYGMPGATRLCAEAALRVGAGLVTVATRSSHLCQINSMRPEIMCFGVERATQLLPLIKRATVIALGPGLGQSAWSKSLFKQAIILNLPKVIDADGLNLLASYKKGIFDAILTPHVGEAARLLGITIQEVEKNRLIACHNIIIKYKSTVVLKGAGSLVGHEKQIDVCKDGNPGMASAGMGDALTGIIAGLLAQGLSLHDAAKLGVALHAHAGDLASQDGERGLLALDLINHLRGLVNPNAR